MATAELEVYTFDPSIANEIDQDSVERNESEFPTLQWHRGDPKMKKLGGMDYQGGFFISEAQAPVDLTDFGWEKTTWEHGPDNETDGFYIRDLSLSLIRLRRRWELYDNGQRSMFAWSDYDAAKAIGRATGRAHWLVLIKGLEEAGPFCITLRGMAAVYFFNPRNSPRSAVGNFDNVILRAANDKVKKAGHKGLMPRRAFWLPVGAARDGAGAPHFIEVGSGADSSHMVVPVAMGLPEKPGDVDLAQYYVGPELVHRTQQIWQETAEWATAWDNIEPGTGEDGSKPAEDKAADEGVGEVVSEEYLNDLGM